MERLQVVLGADSRELVQQVQNAQRSLQNLRPGVNQASQALTNFGRVASDAPYGLIGIANNIEPLIQSFVHLRQEAGSGRGALQALGQSLMGGGGLVLAVSLVTSALQFAQLGFDRWAGSADKAKKSGEDYISTLNQLQQVHLKGAQDAAKEVVELESLYRATQNHNLSLSERKKAVDALQSQYPKYFANIKDEAVLAGNATSAYLRLKDAIIAAARARAAQDLLVKSQQRQLENEQKIADLKAEQNRLVAKQAKAMKGSSMPGAIAAAGMQGLEYNGAIQETVKQINNLITDTVRLKQKDLELTKQIATYTEKNGVDILTGVAAKTGKTGSSVRSNITSRAGSVGASVTNGTLSGGLPAGIGETPFGFDTNRMKTILAEQIQMLKDFNDQAAQVINGSIVDTFTSLGEAIGEAFSSGTNIAESFNKVLLSSIGSVLGQLGKMAIAQGVTLLAIKTSLQTLNPFTAIAAGTALLALSGVVKSGVARLGNSMGSGGSSVGGSYSSPNYNMPSNSVGSTSTSGTVVFRIAGTDLLGVLQNTTGRNLRLNGV